MRLTSLNNRQRARAVDVPDQARVMTADFYAPQLSMVRVDVHGRGYYSSAR
jgi:hypothetical protein